MSIAWYDIVGTVGVALIVGTYLLLQLDRISNDSLVFSLLNGSGALLVIISLIYDFNLSAFLVEFFWLVISLIGIWRWVRRKRNHSKQKTIPPLSPPRGR